jgi:hypothetical protein
VYGKCVQRDALCAFAWAPHHDFVPVAQPQPSLGQEEEERADDHACAQRNAEEATPRNGLHGA